MSKYLITGAAGYIGSMLIKKLNKIPKCELSAIVRSRLKAESMLPDSVKIYEMDLTKNDELVKIQDRFDYIIHCASITKSSDMVNHPLEVTQSIVNATQNIMELALRCHAKSIVYVSSMEVYGNIDCSDGHLCEENEAGKGYVDICNARSCYPLAKRMAENICFGYFKEKELPVKIVRLAQTFGKGVLSNDNRVFAQFARAVLNEQDIVLHTTGKSLGNYCEIEDAINGILTVLNNGMNGEAYNVVNESCTMTIYEMAQLVADKIGKGRISIRFDISKENTYGYAADTGLRLSAKKLRLLDWTPQKDLTKMYEEMLLTMKS